MRTALLNMWNDLMTMKKLSSYKRAEIGWAMWSIGLYNNTWLEEKTFQYQHFGKVIIARSKIIISIPDLECILFNFTQSRYDRNMVIHSMSSSQRQSRLCDYGTPLCVKSRIKSQSLDVVKMIPYLLNQSVNPIPFRIR